MLKTAFIAILSLQTCLDRQGFSPNTLDGVYGEKTHSALTAYCAAKGLAAPRREDWGSACERYFPDANNIFTDEPITAEDIAALTRIPAEPADRARLPRMGYESLGEMFAERGHLSIAALKKLNPDLDWRRLRVGTRIRLPEVSPIAVETKAALVKISFSRFSVTAIDANGKTLAVFPCSIARDKAKLPPKGELKIITVIRNPNYTYTPDFTPPGTKISRYILPPGPNNPVGTAWLGLSLPGYGIHGTPAPESIGRAESHGCFRLANWNVDRLSELVRPGTKVLIEP